MKEASAQFITFEGGEGSGKSLQCRLVHEWLESQSVDHVATREPGGTRFGEELRFVLLRSHGSQRNAKAELLLYLADRIQHLEEVIRPSLEAGKHVISDRYHDATLAYQALARGIGLDWVDRLSSLLEIRRPDRTFLIDLPVEIGLQRARRRNSESSGESLGRFEEESTAFHERVRSAYLHLASRDEERFTIIEGKGSPAEVFARIQPHLKEML